MAKYKIKYKANDSLESNINSFLNSKGYYSQPLGLSILLFVDAKEPVEDSVVRAIEVDIANSLIYASDKYSFDVGEFEDTGDILYLDNDELEFFDRLGFELHPLMTESTGQEITDWYGK
jgi:hypothetical protein